MRPDWKTMPSLAALRAFDAAARRGSFTRAADDLNVTHAAIAQQVRALEAHVGAKLFRRDGRGVALTEEGRRLSQDVHEGFARMAEGVRALREGLGPASVRATTTTFFGEAVILPNLPDFWRRHPEIAVSFVPGACTGPVDFDGFDVGIRAGAAVRWPGFVTEPLVECRILFAAAPSLAASGAAPQDMPWLIGADGADDLAELAAAGLDPARIECRDTGNPALDIEAAKRGLGAVIALDLIVREALEAGTLVALPLEHPARVPYQAVLPEGPVRPAVRSFVDWLKSVL